MEGVVNIRGKQYSTVSKRVNDFREGHSIDDGWTIRTLCVHRDESSVVMKAEILDPTGRTVATGFAEEDRNASKINKTSALENAETSAIGRALAAAGLGGTSYASAEEVKVAIAQQAAAEAPRWTKSQEKSFCADLTRMGLRYEPVAGHCEDLGKPRPSVMTDQQRKGLIKYLRERPEIVARLAAGDEE